MQQQYSAGLILMTISVGILFGYNLNIVSGIFSALTVWGFFVAVSGYTTIVLTKLAKMKKMSESGSQ